MKVKRGRKIEGKDFKKEFYLEILDDDDDVLVLTVEVVVVVELTIKQIFPPVHVAFIPRYAP